MAEFVPELVGADRIQVLGQDWQDGEWIGTLASGNGAGDDLNDQSDSGARGAGDFDGGQRESASAPARRSAAGQRQNPVREKEEMTW